MDLNKLVEQAIADAKAQGATDTEAQVRGVQAREQAEAVLSHPLYKSLDAEARTAFEARDKANTKARAAVATELDGLKTTLAGLQAKLEAAEPQVQRVGKLTEMAKSLLEQELAGVPENLRKLIPAGEPDEQLVWVRQAKAEGVLRGPVKQPPVGGHMPGHASAGTTIKRTAWNALTPAQQHEHIKQGGTVED